MKKKHLNAKGEVIYDYRDDILNFKVKNRDYKRSIEFQNFVADIDVEGFITGVRILDASKVFGIDKYVLKNIVHCDFSASIDNNVITIVMKFVGKRRNRIIPLLSKEENFTQQITTPLGARTRLADSYVKCSIEA